MKNKITLYCADCLSKNYKVDKGNSTKRMIIRKYCKMCNSHSEHKEEK